jgi:hypothetical protein
MMMHETMNVKIVIHYIVYIVINIIIFHFKYTLLESLTNALRLFDDME